MFNFNVMLLELNITSISIWNIACAITAYPIHISHVNL